MNCFLCLTGFHVPKSTYCIVPGSHFSMKHTRDWGGALFWRSRRAFAFLQQCHVEGILVHRGAGM